MKQIAVILLGIALMSMSATAQRKIVDAGAADITGYSNDGMYDVSGEVKTQLQEKVVARIKAKMSRLQYAQVEINIMGCATPTGGTIAQNSTAGTTRATNAEGFLSGELQEFPNVKFDKPWSNGSETKTRQVVVHWTISVPAAPVNDHKVLIVKIAASVVAGIAIVILIGLRSTRKPPQTVIVVPQAQPVAAPSPQKDTVRIRRKTEGKWAGMWFKTTITGINVGNKETERWDCVFPEPNKFRKTRSGVMDAAKSGLNRLSDAEVQEYIDNHLITIKEEEHVS